jgi:hypothetical protein
VEVRSTPARSATAIDGVRSDPTTSPSRQLWEADQRALERMDPWRDPNIVITKNADGTLSSRPRNGGAPNGTPPDAGGQPQPQQTPPAGPASVTEGGHLKVGDFELTSDDIRGLMERKGVEDSRRAQRPATPGDYALELPAGFEIPDGTQWKWDTEGPVSGPMIGLAKQFAYANGLDQVQFSQMMSLFAAHQLHE